MKPTSNNSDPLSIYCKEIRAAAPILGLTAADIEVLLARKRKLEFLEKAKRANEKLKMQEAKRKAAKGNAKNALAVIYIRHIPRYAI